MGSKGSAGRKLRGQVPIAAAGLAWTFQITFAAFGQMLTAPWDRLIGAVTITCTVWAMLAIRDDYRDRRSGDRMKDEERIDLIISAVARGYAAGSSEAGPQPERQLRSVPTSLGA